MRKLLELSWTGWRFLCKATLVMAMVRLTLGVLPFAVVHRLFTCVGVKTTQRVAPEASAVQQMIWSVKVAGRYLPRVTCLVEAYTLHYLLSRQGVNTRVRIGVMHSQKKQLEAHAWVEHEGVVLIGALPNFHDYTALPTLECVPS
jgi:hypothetical protein